MRAIGHSIKPFAEAEIAAKIKSRSISKQERFLLYFNLSELYHDEERYDLSLRAMRNAMRYKKYASNKYRQIAYNNLGVLYLKRDRLRVAFRQFLKCLRINPWHPIANRLAGEIFIIKGYPYPAMSLLVKAARHRYCRTRTLTLIVGCLQAAGHDKFANDIMQLVVDATKRNKLKTLKMSFMRSHYADDAKEKQWPTFRAMEIRGHQ